ncbi:MAG: substrate-binding domain-containing protein [Sphaerochaeta sp.]|nr:substrate-binding domain-containing protein [Sphaerochaeta sp.]
MKKIVSVMLVLCLLGGLVMAQGKSETSATSASNGKGVIYGIYKAGDQTWFIDEGDAAKKVANDAGYDFIYVDAKMSPEEYLRAIDNAIANKAAGVVTCIPDQTLSRAVVDKLNAANIPVVAADDALEENGKKIAPWVGINAYIIGEANGAWLADYAKKNNLVGKSDVALLIMTMDTVSSCVPRAEGEYAKFIADCPDFDTAKIYKADYDGTSDKGYAAADAVFTAHPEIKVWLVTGANEEGTIGGLRALEAAGKADASCVVGLGGYLAKDEWNNNGKKSGMKAAAYFSSESVGAGSVKVLLDLIAGKDVTVETAVDAVVVTPETYKSVMGKYAN